LNPILRKAQIPEAEIIWQILQQAIERRRKDGSNQWQDGYPNLEVVKTDISLGKGYVLEIDNAIAAYAALVFNDEPAYKEIIGDWLTNDDFLVIHRVAVSDDFLGKGIAVLLFQN
jgi:GNAT superfamily N-acetyltransferase